MSAADPEDPVGEDGHAPVAPLVDVQRGTASDDELAALVAVLTEAYAQEAASAVADDTPGRSPWSIAARSLRQPLRHELGWSSWGA